MKKRILSILIVLSMILPTFSLLVSAIDSSADYGELNLTIKQPLVADDDEFKAELYSDGKSTPDYTGILSSIGNAEINGRVSGIKAGTYHLKLTADNHLTYEQDLTFNDDGVNLTLYNSVAINDGLDEDSPKYGVMAIGDVNGDGKINDADAEIVTDAIQTDDTKYDLNGDGTTDLIDLTYVVRNYTDGNVEAVPVHTVSSIALRATVKAEVNTETTKTVVHNALGESVEGNIKDILLSTTNNYVTLMPKDDDELISEENPIEVTLALDEKKTDSDPGALVEGTKVEAITIVSPVNSTSLITDGSMLIEYVDDDGTEMVISAPLSEYTAPQQRMRKVAAEDSNSASAFVFYADASSYERPKEVIVESDGTIVINIGKKVAIKKVSIQITGTTDGKLADIAKVEFLGDFEERIPEPVLSKPTIDADSITNTEGEYKEVTVSWDRQTNVTGYEVSISGKNYNKTGVTSSTSYTFPADSFNGSPAAFEDYTIMVRSINGDWKSGWSDPVVYTIKCKSKPNKPEYVSVSAGILSLKVSWRALYDTQTWSLFYKSENDQNYTEIKNLSTPSYTLTNLTGGAKYTFYVVGHNVNGSSPASAPVEGTPQTATGVVMPNYKLINVNDEDGYAMTHISSISGAKDKSYTIYKSDGTTPVTNSTATSEDWKAVADNDPASYLLIDDWDSGVSYANFRGPIINLDSKYTLDTIRIAPSEGATVFANSARIGYKDENGTVKVVNAAFYTKYDSQNKRYHEIILNEPVTSDYFEIRLSTGYARGMTVSEVKLYAYDSIENDVKALFADDMRTTLKEGVTQKQIEKLINRVNTADEVSGEFHPHRDTILADLNYAMTFLKEGTSAEIIKVDTNVTSKNEGQLGFAQALSDYQPLGYVAAAKDTVVVYVSSPTKQRGQSTSLNLVISQYHPEVSSWSRSVQTLVAGRNEIQIPAITSAVKEKGGSLYIQYTGNKGAEQYNVRISGSAYKIPMLNVDGLEGTERTEAISAYISELGEYVNALNAQHNDIHLNSSNDSVAYAYNEKECFLNSTEIVMDNIFFSFPATQVWRGINNDASKSAAEELKNAIDAIEQEVRLFYQFKGLNENADASDTDRFPITKLNIRYHQMFTGAFMYAGGKHIGIEFGSVGGLFDTNPIVTDENGKRLSGNYSGWGIAHEIGHCINSAAYQRVEVTNNVFAALAQTDETNKTFRGAFNNSYETIYKAVVSGTTGHTGNLAVQLAMYWQLHLAYDNGYSYKFYDTAEEQKANLFYARLDSYMRNTSKAPTTDAPLLLNSDSDNNFMRAACAAAEKDILFFFEAWGIHPNAETIAYAAQFEKETRKIQYIDDNSRLYRMTSGEGMSAGTAVTAEITNAVNRRINGNRVVISLSNSNTADDAMLGYEITRNGKTVAFVGADKTQYIDIVSTENNKTFTYAVTAIDKNLNSTETVIIGDVKICHDGSIDKTGWTAKTNMTSVKDSIVEKDENDPESGSMSGNTTPAVEKTSAIGAVIDNDVSTVYYGTAGTGNNRPYISLYLGKVEQVTAIKITPASEDYTGDASDKIAASDLYKHRIFGYKVEISLDGTNWTAVKTGDAYTGSANNPSSWVRQNNVIYNEDGSYTLYFNKTNADGTTDPFMYTYDAAYVKITATNMSGVAVAELDVLGPTNDNVELIDSGFGRLTEDFIYSDGVDADGNEYKIPKDSVVFYGSYKGDPSYNVVELRDQNNVILGGNQIILADVPEKGFLGETSDGRWFFWFETEEELAQLENLVSVQAELYRVDNALTLGGERLTSNSLRFTLPSEYPEIRIASEATSAVLCLNYAENALVYNDAATARNAQVSLTAKDDKVEFTMELADNTISASTTILLEADKNVGAAIEWSETDGDVYKAYRYSDGKLNIYVVAQHGCLNNTVSGTVSLTDLPEIGKVIAKLSADTIKQIDANYEVSDNTFDSFAELTVGEDPKYVLNFNVNGGSEIAAVTEFEGTEIDLGEYTPTKEGYDFTGWYSDEALANKVSSVTLTADTTVYAGWNKQVIPVNGLTLDKTTATVETADGTFTLTPVFSPENADNKNLTWSSDDESVATVKDGVVTVLRKGTVTITATTEDGGFTASCVVTVNCSHKHVTSYPADGSNCIHQGHGAYDVCDECGEIINGTDEELPLADHNFVEKADAKYLKSVATCNTKAVYYKSCSVCGVRSDDLFFEYGAFDSNNHVGETYVKDQKAATCCEEGYTGDTYCKDCNAKIADGKTVSKLPHKLNKVEAKAPTHEAEGNIEYFKCSACGKLFRDANATAEITLKDTVIAKIEHDYGDTYRFDAENHWKECDCGKIIDKTAHSFGDWNVVKEATETEEGIKEKVCTVCGYKVEENIPAVHHQLVKVDAKAPTEDADGNIEYFKCSVCGKLFADADGVTEITLEDTVIAKNEHEHNYGDDYQTDAENHWKVCECGEIIDKTEHTFGDWNIIKEATETEDGVKEKVCAVCGYKVEDIIPAITNEPSTSDVDEPSTSDVDEPTTADASEPTTFDANEPTKPAANQMPEKSPQTGAASSITIWILLMFVSVGSIGAMAVVNKKKRVK